MKEKLLEIYNKKHFNKILFLSEIFFSFLSLACLYKQGTSDNNIYYKLFFIAILLLLANIFLLLKKYWKKIEYIFLILIIPLGLSYNFLMIPTNVPDESSHIAKAYTVMKGDLFPKKDKDDIPQMKTVSYFSEKTVNLLTSFKGLSVAIHQKTNYQKESITTFDAFAGYFFGCYIIPSIGLLIGSLLNINFIIACFLGRLLNLIFFIITGFYCLKHIPIGKLVLFTYLLTPMILQEAASFASDACINCISIIFITYLLYLKFNDKTKKVTIKEVSILGFLCIMLGSSKIVYFPLILLLLLIGKKIKNSSKKTKLVLGGFLVVSIICTVFSYLQSSKYNVFIEHKEEFRVDSEKQIQYVLDHPIRYLQTTINTLREHQAFYIQTFAGQSLGAFTIGGLYISTLTIMFLLLIAPFLEKNKFSFSRKEKILINFLAIISFNCILGALYITWSTYTTPVISGVQGRYFIPIFILTLLTIVQKDKFIQFKNPKLYYIVLLLIINFASLHTVFFYFR